MEHDYDIFVSKFDDEIIKDSKYLGYFGKITATDGDGNDISNNIVIAELILTSDVHYAANYNGVAIYVEDTKGNNLLKEFWIDYDFSNSVTVDLDDFVRCYNEFHSSDQFQYRIGKDQFILIDQNPVVYARLRRNTELKEGQ